MTARRRPPLNARRLRIESCEARRLLSADTLAGEALSYEPAFQGTLTFLTSVNASGWASIDGDSQLTPVVTSRDDGLVLFDDQTGGQNQVTIGDADNQEYFKLSELVINGITLRFQGSADDGAAQDLNHFNFYDLGEIAETVINGVPAGWDRDFDVLPTDVVTDDLVAGDAVTGETNRPLDLTPDPVDNSADFTANQGADNTPSAPAGDQHSVEETPAVRAWVAPITRVAMTEAPPAGADRIDAGRIDLAMLLLDAPHASASKPASLADAEAREPQAPLAARDAALAVESWVRVLPTRADASPATQDAPQQATTPAPAIGIWPLGPTEQPAGIVEEGTDKVSAAAPTTDTPATQEAKASSSNASTHSAARLERSAAPRYAVAVLTTAVGGGLIWGARRTDDPSRASDCVELPPRSRRRSR